MLKLRAALKIRPLMETLRMKEDLLKLEVLAVSRQHQGQGIAKRLVKEAEVIASQIGVNTIYLTTANNENVEIYERLGFTCVEKRNLDDFSCFHIIKKVATA